MSEHEKADDARKGLIESIKGKAKEAVGAVIRNDALTAEGQVEQAQAKQRKEANRLESVADAEVVQAEAEMTEAKWEGAEERATVNEEARAQEDAIRRSQATQKQQAEQAGALDAAKGQTEAELTAQHRQAQAKAEENIQVNAAQAEVADALDGHQQAVHESAAARAEADRIRRQADSLTDAADVPKDSGE
jgi:uncharacterized protein YjbJ (UPF0337 family)